MAFLQQQGEWRDNSHLLNLLDMAQQNHSQITARYSIFRMVEEQNSFAQALYTLSEYWDADADIEPPQRERGGGRMVANG